MEHVDHDNLEANIRHGLIRSDAKAIVDKLTDAQVTALCKDGNPPRFMPTKKATKKDPHAADEKFIRGKRGGVVHISRNATVDDLLKVTGVKDATQESEIKKELFSHAKAIEQSGKSDSKTITLAPISQKMADEIKKVCGITPKSLTPTVCGDEIRLSFNHHGKHIDGLTRGEKNKKQIPITADDIARIKTIINEYDKIEKGSFNETENAESIKLIIRFNDGINYSIFINAETLKYKIMWKKKN